MKIKTTISSLLIAFALVCFALPQRTQAVGPDTDGSIPGSNNGEGVGVLVNRTGGVWNTGTGFEALNHLTAGNQNTATGLRALTNDTNGGYNTATGVLSLFSNTSGFFNSATGAYALANNISGSYNTANGYGALYRSTGDDNTATGFAALNHNTTGVRNTATGSQALFSNTGAGNTANGYGALVSNTTGVQNTANGFEALFSNTTGVGNIGLGSGAGNSVTTANNVICIGAVSGANVSGSCFIANIYGVTTISPTTLPVVVSINGQLGTVPSSGRFKNEIRPMDKVSEAILALKPVTFHYKSDNTGTPQFGLIAEEVAAVNPDLVVRDEKGEIYTVRYDAVNAMLLNEFLKEHRAFLKEQRQVEEQGRKAKEQEATITQLKSTVAQQQKSFQSKLAEQDQQIKALTSGLQQVSAQLEANKPASQVVLNKP